MTSPLGRDDSVPAMLSNGEYVASAGAVAAAPEPTPPTQVKHPWRTVLRTFLQNLPVIGVVIAAITQTAQDQQIGWVEAWGPGAIALGLFLTRVMAIPAVNELLTNLNLGAAPKAATPAGN